jgi:lipopolysaccharide transport protein LptA
MTPADIVGALARVNLAAAAAILIVLALRKPLRSISGARLAYGLWLAPLLASMAVMAPARTVVVVGMLAPAATFRLPFGDVSPSSLGSGLDLFALLVGIWLAGVLGAGLVMVVLQWRFERAARRGAAGPAVVGVVAPAIVTPADFEARFDRRERDLILAHERAHIARQDSRLNGLCCIVQCLCWFNPLIHIAAHLMRIDQELACDEAVIISFPDARRAYAEVLVKAQLSTRPLPLGCYWPSESEHPLVERIAMLKQKSFGPIHRWAGACSLALVCAGAGFAAWAAQPAIPRITPSVPQAGPVQAAPMDITANQLRVADAGHRTIWRGDVSAVQGGDRLMSDVVNVYSTGARKPLQRLVADGHVLLVSAHGTARADHAVYEPQAQTLTLTGDVVAVQDLHEFRGQKLVIAFGK